MEKKQRTVRQNAALHMFFQHLADELNGAGLDLRATLRPGIEIPWSPELVKEYLWRPVQQLQLGKESTTELSTGEVSLVYDTLNRHLGEKFGVTVAFPSEEEARERSTRE